MSTFSMSTFARCDLIRPFPFRTALTFASAHRRDREFVIRLTDCHAVPLAGMQMRKICLSRSNLVIEQ